MHFYSTQKKKYKRSARFKLESPWFNGEKIASSDKFLFFFLCFLNDLNDSRKKNIKKIECRLFLVRESRQ